MESISFEDFKKVELRVGKIIAAEPLENSDKLLKLQVDFGDQQHQILAGIAKFYQPADIVGKLCPFVFNLEPKMLAGLESQGMILAADDGRPILLHPDREIKPGSILK